MIQLETEIKNYLGVATSIALSRVSISIFYISILWLTFVLTHSIIITGFADGLVTIPLILSFLVGNIIDKGVNKKRIAIIASVVRGLFVVPLATFYYLSDTEFIVISIMVLSFSVGLTSDFVNSVRAIWIKRFLKDKSKVKKYRAYSNIFYNVAEGIGYVLSGVLIVNGVSLTLLTLIFAFELSTVPIIFIKTKDESKELNGENTPKLGMTYVYRSVKKTPVVFALFAEGFLLNFVYGTFGVISTFMVVNFFDLSALYLSLVFIVITIGISFGSFLERGEGSAKIEKAAISIFVIALMFLAIRFLQNFLLILIPVFVIGASIGVGEIVIFSSIQNNVEEEITGTVQGAFNSLSTGVTFISGPLIGGVISIVGYLNSYVVLFTSSAILSSLLLLFTKVVRSANRSPETG